MLVHVRDKSFTDKKKNETINYKELYVTFEFCIDGKNIELIDLPFKIGEKLGKQMLIENLDTADFDIKESLGKNGNVYYYPVVNFTVCGKAYSLVAKLSPEGIVLARIGLAGVTNF